MEREVRSAERVGAHSRMRAVPFSLRQCYAILRRAGARWASQEAVEELSKSLEEIGLEISKLAVLYADDSSRLKVTDLDVRSALKEFLEKRME